MAGWSGFDARSFSDAGEPATPARGRPIVVPTAATAAAALGGRLRYSWAKNILSNQMPGTGSGEDGLLDVPLCLIGDDKEPLFEHERPLMLNGSPAPLMRFV